MHLAFVSLSYANLFTASQIIKSVFMKKGMSEKRIIWSPHVLATWQSSLEPSFINFSKSFDDSSLKKWLYMSLEIPR